MKVYNKARKWQPNAQPTENGPTKTAAKKRDADQKLTYKKRLQSKKVRA